MEAGRGRCARSNEWNRIAKGAIDDTWNQNVLTGGKGMVDSKQTFVGDIVNIKGAAVVVLLANGAFEGLGGNDDCGDARSVVAVHWNKTTSVCGRHMKNSFANWGVFLETISPNKANPAWIVGAK